MLRAKFTTIAGIAVIAPAVIAVGVSLGAGERREIYFTTHIQTGDPPWVEKDQAADARLRMKPHSLR